MVWFIVLAYLLVGLALVPIAARAVYGRTQPNSLDTHDTLTRERT